MNINLTREPRFSGLGKQTRPPVRETICNWPSLRLPSRDRRTAGVMRGSRTRGLRWIVCDGCVMDLSEYGPRCGRAGDYGRTLRDTVTHSPNRRSTARNHRPKSPFVHGLSRLRGIELPTALCESNRASVAQRGVPSSQKPLCGSRNEYDALNA